MEKIINFNKNYNMFVSLLTNISLSLFLSYMCTKSLILNDTKLGYNIGILFFIISFILFFIFTKKFILLFYYLLGIILNKFAIRVIIKDIKTKYKLVFIPSILLGISSLYLSTMGIYLNYIDLNTLGNVVEYRRVAISLNSKLIPIFTIIFVLVLFIRLFVYLFKYSESKKIRLSASIFLTLILSIIIIFLVTNLISSLYWFIAIFSTPWRFG